jgi:hypothetical protein
MVQLLVRFTVAPERVEDVLRTLETVRLPAQLDRNSLRTYLGTDSQESEVVVYLEEWPGQGELSQRMADPSFSRLLRVLEEATAPPLFEVRFLSETRGFDFVASVAGRVESPDGPAAASPARQTV